MLDSRTVCQELLLLCLAFDKAPFLQKISCCLGGPGVRALTGSGGEVSEAPGGSGAGHGALQRLKKPGALLGAPKATSKGLEKP